jgi:hypothetical protein
MRCGSQNSRKLHRAETPAIYGESTLFDPRARPRARAGGRLPCSIQPRYAKDTAFSVTIPHARILRPQTRPVLRGSAPRRAARIISATVARLRLRPHHSRRFFLRLALPVLGEGQGCISRCNPSQPREGETPWRRQKHRPRRAASRLAPLLTFFSASIIESSIESIVERGTIWLVKKARKISHRVK